MNIKHPFFKMSIKSPILIDDGEIFKGEKSQNKKGDVYLFCYEVGFKKIIENSTDKYILIQWQDYMTKK